MSLDADTLERLVPESLHGGDVTGRRALDLHLARYEFAAAHARDGRLLDIACGVGYGTRHLVERSRADFVAVGVDISDEAIAYATKQYGHSRIQFLVADAMQFADPGGFDTIVSLETIEHLPAPAVFFARLARLLRPGGVLVASVPTTPSVDVNPHHFHDFTARSFRALGRAHGLLEVDCLHQVQPVSVRAVLRRSESRTRDVRPHLSSYYLAHPRVLARRLWATLRHGFANHYLTVAWQAAR